MRKKESFWISELIQRVIDFSLLPTFLRFTSIEDEVREKLIMHCRDFKKNKTKRKEKTDFYLIEINRKNFNINLNHLFREVNKGKLKLSPANDLELVLFHPPLWKSLYHILFGMRIIIFERPESNRHGIPVYFSSDSGILTNKIDYVPEVSLFSNKRSLYVLAKAVPDNKVLISQIVERQLAIKTCQEKLGDIEKNLEVLEISNSEEFRSKIITELKSVEKITIDLEYTELKKRVEGIKNRLCYHSIS